MDPVMEAATETAMDPATAPGRAGSCLQKPPDAADLARVRAAQPGTGSGFL
jgi:hypothetical protein